MEQAQLNQILQQTRDFVQQKLIPLESKLLAANWTKVQPILDELRTQAKQLGLWNPHISKDWGGLGLALAEFGRMSAVLGQSPFAHYVFNCQAPDVGNMEILMEYGTAEQQDQFLKPLLAGEIRSCFAMTEPEFAGSNPIYMNTTVVREGDYYVINGHKWFTTAAEGASFAIVMCITEPDAKNPYERASQIIVPTDTPGFEHVRKISIMGTEGGGWMSHSEVRFNNCKVLANNLLGKAGKGFALAQTRLGPGRIHHCMRWIGICDRAFDLMCLRALSRELEPGKPLASRQTIQNWIAERYVEIKAARMMVLDAAQQIDAGGTEAAKIDISAIKFYCANVLQKTLDCAIQVHGAMGISDDTPLAMWYAHERGARIYDGADEVHKSRVAKYILKSYAK